jgi:hypothetical protein
MDKDIRHDRVPSASEAATGTAPRVGGASDPTPPADHAEFVALRSIGLRAVRENLARRKKAP